MKALHITFRYGTEIYGGAELYFRHLSEELVKRGVEVDVCTTCTNSLTSLIKSCTLFDNTLHDATINGVNVFRFPVINPNKYVSFIFEKILQKTLDHEEINSKYRIRQNAGIYFPDSGALLLDGWNQLERYGNFQMRWSKSEAVILVHGTDIQAVSFSLHNPKGLPAEVQISGAGYCDTLKVGRIERWETLSFDLPDLTGKLAVTFRCPRCWRPLKDHRSLGIAISDVEYTTASGRQIVDLECDYRHFLTKQNKYIPYLMQNAGTRSMYCGAMFDYLRGPCSPQMMRWLKKNVRNYDVVLAQMFPFTTMNYSLIAQKYHVPLIFLPLMHVDDEFYHWKHYYDMLRRADCIFALTSYSKEHVFDVFNKNCHDIGAGIAEETFLSPQVDGEKFREKFHLGKYKIILTVSRKSSSKRYEHLIRAVERIKHDHPEVILVMVGPDDDKKPVNSENVLYLGRLSEEDLVNAYDACDLFAMMSESESFGMVFCEAWARKKPVIGNRNCGAVATLIDDGTDGLLCADDEELTAAIVQLLEDQQYAARLGKSGYTKVIERYTWNNVAEHVLACYKEFSSH
jgi:glycosyltransferase involved in cell wall biosynthesis